MNILVTGAAGFIGSAVCARLLRDGHEVTGIDSINDYYDPQLKYDRLMQLGIREGADRWQEPAKSVLYPQFTFIRQDIGDRKGMESLFESSHFDVIINLAAQAGVRYSLENPRTYIETNVAGFLNILEGCRTSHVGHLIFASSSSVYGLNGHVPYSEHDATVHPISLYAATKKADELMAHTYSHLYSIPVTGLRLFTVYGPWGRPDMSPFLFMDAILHHRPIKVFNNGDMWRDFTYIDDIVEGIVRLIDHTPQPDPEWDSDVADPASSSAPYRIYNIGNQNPTRLMDYIHCIERAAGMDADINFLPMQPGDVYKTYADTSELEKTTGFRPDTCLADGIQKTISWFKEYYSL